MSLFQDYRELFNITDVSLKIWDEILPRPVHESSTSAKLTIIEWHSAEGC